MLRRYVARWLLVDVVSTVPFDTLLALFGLAEAKAGGKLLGLSRIVRLVRRALNRIGSDYSKYPNASTACACLRLAR